MKKPLSPICQKYVTALKSVAEKHDVLETVLQDLSTLEDCFTQEPTLQRVIQNPKRASALFDALFQTLPFSPLTINFIKTVIHHRRLPLLLPIIQAFITQIRYPEQVVSITVARPLSSSQQSDLSALFQQARLSVTVDPKILGGMIVQIRSYRIDGSLRTKLSSLSPIPH